jgi:ferric iron reductase protein FhuF
MKPLPALDPLRHGAFGPYLSSLLQAEADEDEDEDEALGGIRADALASPEVMADLTQRFRPRDVAIAPRAVLAFWTQHYFLRLLPPVLTATVLAARSLDLTPSRVTLLVDDTGAPTAFVLARDGDAPAQEPVGRDPLCDLRDAHLAPLIAAWSAWTGLSARLFWGNAERYLQWTFRHLAASEVRAWPDESVFTTSWARGRKRPCCLRDHLEGVPICADCPKLKRKTLKEEAHA